MTPLMRVDIFFANACFDWVVISGEDGSPLAVGGFHQTLGRQVVVSLSHFFANPVCHKTGCFSLPSWHVLYLFPGREQSSWLLCLTVRRRTSIRWGTIFPTFCNLDNFFHYSYWIGEFFENFSISIEWKFCIFGRIPKIFALFCGQEPWNHLLTWTVHRKNADSAKRARHTAVHCWLEE